MKKIAFLLASTLLTANATITITDATVTNLGDENGVELTSPNTYALLVAFNNDSFEDIVMGDTVSIGQTIGNGKYFVLDAGESQPFPLAPGTGFVASGAGPYDLSSTPLANDAFAGQNVAMIWFPDLTGTGVTLNTGDIYGVARDSTWILPKEGENVSFNNLFGNTQTAEFVVIVPEPTSALLFSGGLLGFALRRRRS